MQDTVISGTIAAIRQTKVLNDYAKKNNIALTESQNELLESAIEKRLSEDPEYNELVGLTEEMARTIYTENAVANAVYLNLIADVDKTVGDDEFIRKDITYVRISPTDLEEATEAATEAAESGTGEAESEAVSETVTAAGAEETEAEPETEGTDLSAEEQAQSEAIEAAAEDIRERLENGEDASVLVSEYNADGTYFTVTQSTTTLSDTSTYVYTEAGYALATGETAIFPDENTGAVYVLLCTNDNDTEARESAIHTEIQNREAALFTEKYADIEKASPKFTVDEDVLAKISFDTPLYVKEEETSTAPEIETEDGTADAVPEIGTEALTEEESEKEPETEAETEEEGEKEPETEAETEESAAE